MFKVKMDLSGFDKIKRNIDEVFKKERTITIKKSDLKNKKKLNKKAEKKVAEDLRKVLE